jgi:hypothetical protein
MKNPLLIFAMGLDETPQINVGRLFLVDLDTGIQDEHKWQCTSGVGSWQGNRDWNKVGGGVIPPTYKLNPNPGFYRLATKPRWQNLSGIEGNTYLITPTKVKTVDGVTRSEIILHKSRHDEVNRIASMGCIVLPEDEFRGSSVAFEETFKRECSHLESVKLLVLYTF